MRHCVVYGAHWTQEEVVQQLHLSVTIAIDDARSSTKNRLGC